MRWQLAGLMAVAAVSYPCLAGAGNDTAPKRPHLQMRASPRIAFSPVEVLVIGELKGGQDSEEYYCPGLVWDWGDGSRSAHESDCSPYKDGAEVDRLFTARHAFRYPGSYEVRLYLLRAGRMLTAATIPVMVYGHTAGSPDY